MSDERHPEPSQDALPHSTALLRVAWRLLAVGALALLVLLGVGFALPGDWTIEREIEIQAPPPDVFALLDDPADWQEWNPWPEIELTAVGPERGEGAGMEWDDPFAGDGSFRIVRSRPDSVLAYRVEVEGGSIVTDGHFRLASTQGGTRVVWEESGSFGWNPLLAYAALRMDRTQGTELERGLQRLKEHAETGGR